MVLPNTHSNLTLRNRIKLEGGGSSMHSNRLAPKIDNSDLFPLLRFPDWVRHKNGRHKEGRWGEPKGGKILVDMSRENACKI
eukprot:6391208-Karenia_brevis.AAC.1